MALWYEQGKQWRYEFQVQGRRYVGAGFKTKAEARAAMEEKRHQVKEVPKPAGTTFSTIANLYLDQAERRFTVKTYKYKRYVLGSFLAHAGDLPLDQINVTAIESYLVTRQTNTNYNRHRKDLCALFTWAWKRGMMKNNPCLHLDKMPEPRFIRKIPIEEEMAKIMLAAGPDRPFLLVLYHTMARLDEVLRMRWEDVDFDNRQVRLWTRKRKDGSWESDLVPMNEVLHDVLLSLKTRSGKDAVYIFVNPATGTRYHHRPKLMRGICKRAGVPHFGFHAIRHYVASYLHSERGVTTAKLSKLLRHKSRRTTELYLQVVEPELRGIMAELEDKEDEKEKNNSRDRR